MREEEISKRIHDEVDRQITTSLKRIRKLYNTIISILGGIIVIYTFTLVWIMGNQKSTIESNTEAIKRMDHTLEKVNDNLLDQATINGQLLKNIENENK